MNRKFFTFAFVALAAISLAMMPAASAHKTTYSADGKIKIVWGFLHEPAVTWTKTGLDLRFSDNATGAPIVGAQDTVEAHLTIGEDALHLDALAGQHGNPGAYTQVVTLTKAGIYTLKLHGMVNGSEVDLAIDGAHAVEDVESTFFPKVDESPYSEDGEDAGLAARVTALETEIAALKAKIATQSRTPATVAGQPTTTPSATSAPVPAAGLVFAALAVAGAALLLRRK